MKIGFNYLVVDMFIDVVNLFLVELIKMIIEILCLIELD